MESTATGLSRRRVANSTTASNESGDENNGSDRQLRGTSATTTSERRANGHAGTALAGGNKVARLNLTEEVILIGLKDKAGYLSFWNDSISYALRGCILLELALRKRIAVVNSPRRRQFPLSERVIEVVEERMTGETLLDEALKLIRDKGREGEKLSVNVWVDLMSGETWNVMKISYQLKQVRERIQKGLVDKGLLSTSKTNFLLFDMATHPTTPLGISNKNEIVNRINSLLFSKSTAIPPSALHEEGTQCRVLRSVALSVASYAASVLENALGQGRAALLGFEEKEEAFQRCDDILQAFSVVPFLSSSSPSGGSSSRRRSQRQVTTSGSTSDGQEAISELTKEATKELQLEGGDSWELFAEVVGAVFEVWGRMDSIL